MAMGAEPLFTSLDGDDQVRVSIEFDGQAISVLDNVPLASALLEAGVEYTRRHPVSAAPRNAYCMMGVCFECLVSIEGVLQQACQVPTRSGLCVSRHAIHPAEEASDE
jgi:predicted molibdopterin-dependent oxidoreductase YjgC